MLNTCTCVLVEFEGTVHVHVNASLTNSFYFNWCMSSPLVKKMTAKKRVATPSTLVKDAPSAGLSPSKIPHLTSSFGRSVKRLRSVSLERLSCQELTKAKRKSKGSNAENCDGVDTGKTW